MTKGSDEKEAKLEAIWENPDYSMLERLLRYSTSRSSFHTCKPSFARRTVPPQWRFNDVPFTGDWGKTEGRKLVCVCLDSLAPPQCSWPDLLLKIRQLSNAVLYSVQWCERVPIFWSPKTVRWTRFSKEEIARSAAPSLIETSASGRAIDQHVRAMSIFHNTSIHCGNHVATYKCLLNRV